MQTPFLSDSLVSIVSPVFNGASYISRFLDSLLQQTFRPLQLILVNDGSTDETSDILESYRTEMQRSGIEYIVLDQSNQGQVSAVENGLKHVSGEYLVWPDSDDLLMPSSIEDRVNFLKMHQDVGFVISDGVECLEGDLDHVVRYVRQPVPHNGDVSRYMLEAHTFWSPSPMVRTSILFAANPSRKLFASRIGQNTQLLLPIALMSKAGALRRPLFLRVLRPNSHSHSVGPDLDALLARLTGHHQIVAHTALAMDDPVARYRAAYALLHGLRDACSLSSKHDKPDVYKIYRRLLWSQFALVAKLILRAILMEIRRWLPSWIRTSRKRTS